MTTDTSEKGLETLIYQAMTWRTGVELAPGPSPDEVPPEGTELETAETA